MDSRIENLPSTTFFGHRLTRRQIADIQETVALCPALSRRELGHTVCEHLGWYTAKGATRVRMGLGLLEQLEDLGILTLPAPRAAMRRGPRKAIARTDRTAPQPAITGALATLTPLTLELSAAGVRTGTRRSTATTISATRSPSGRICATGSATATATPWAACCSRRLPRICPAATAGSAGRRRLACAICLMSWNNMRFLVFPWVFRLRIGVQGAVNGGPPARQ